MKKNDGFTLIELLVMILASSLVMLAAMSYLLVGMRVEHGASETLKRQQTSRIVLTMIENLANNNRISSIEYVGDEGDDWVLFGPGYQPLVRYRATEKTLVSGMDGVLMENLDASAYLSSDGLLRVSLSTDGTVYSSSIYIRLLPEVRTYGKDDLLNKASASLEASENGRYAFLALLASQYTSTGQIIKPEGDAVESTPAYRYDYFTQWYAAQKGLEWNPSGSGWSPETAWCATYVSWAAGNLNTPSDIVLSKVPLFASVDVGMAQFGGPVVGDALNSNGDPVWGETVGTWRWANDPEDLPLPGDLVFFDWDGDGDTQHVGTVMFVDEDSQQIYTIEGNSDDKVAVRCYAFSDPDIVGYGVLDWNVIDPMPGI